jgi:hypothetical protein
MSLYFPLINESSGIRYNPFRFPIQILLSLSTSMEVEELKSKLRKSGKRDAAENNQ